MAKYIHLYRDKWMKVEEEEVDGKYFEGQKDDEGRDYDSKVERWHEIVISEELPR